jgi:hypothetical protein
MHIIHTHTHTHTHTYTHTHTLTCANMNDGATLHELGIPAAPDAQAVNKYKLCRY